jgi:acyl-CoA thioesterase-1
LRIEVENAGLGGETAKALLARKRYERDLLTLGRADVFVISYAGNDVRSYGPAEYEGYLRDMIARLRSDFPEARIVLQTAGYYDYPEHYAFDQNSRQAGHMEVVRKLAAAGPGGADALLDFYEITERLARGGDWDIRYRSHPQWKLVLDGRYDAELGGSAEYFSNPHYNRRGTGLIAEALDQLLAVEGWLDR